MDEHTINWSQAQETIKEATEQQQKKITEFLESNHEMTDAKDLLFYIEATGKDIFWLLDNGKGISPLIKQPLLLGATLDDVIHVDPLMIYEAQADKIVFKIHEGTQEEDIIINWEIKEATGLYWEQLTEKEKEETKLSFKQA